jgi:hypothetical protein
MTASSKNKPQVVHQSDINTELPPQEINSGMRARVTINFYGYNRSGKKGVGCGLGNVMKTRDDEPLAGGANAATDFAGIAPAPAYSAQPAYNTVPVQQQYAAPVQPQYVAAPAQIAPGPGAVNPLTGQPYYG